MFETRDDLLRRADGSLNCAYYAERARDIRVRTQRQALNRCCRFVARLAALARRIASRAGAATFGSVEPRP